MHLAPHGVAPTVITLPDPLKAVLDSRAFAHLTTLDPDGTPQSSAMWIMRDGDRIVFNTSAGLRRMPV